MAINMLRKANKRDILNSFDNIQNLPPRKCVEFEGEQERDSDVQTQGQIFGRGAGIKWWWSGGRHT